VKNSRPTHPIQCGELTYHFRIAFSNQRSENILIALREAFRGEQTCTAEWQSRLAGACFSGAMSPILASYTRIYFKH
jgi:hypothetical protein